MENIDQNAAIQLVKHQLQPWFENIKKRQVKSPKVYIRDSGILHALLGLRNRSDLIGHPKCGASWEGYVIEESDLIRVSPCRFRHINKYGKYHFNVERERNREQLRPLRQPLNT